MRHLTGELTKATLEDQDLALSSARMYIAELALGTGPFSSEAYPMTFDPKLKGAFAYELAPFYHAVNITTHPESLKQSIKEDWYTYTMIQAWENAVGYSLNSMRCESQVMLRIGDFARDVFERDGGDHDSGLVRLMSYTMAIYVVRMRVMQIYGQESLIGVTSRDVWIGNADYERDLQKEMGRAQIRWEERDLKFEKLRETQSRG